MDVSPRTRRPVSRKNAVDTRLLKATTPRNSEQATTPRNSEQATTPRNSEQATTPRNSEQATTPRSSEQATTPRELMVNAPNDDKYEVVQDLDEETTSRNQLSPMDRVDVPVSSEMPQENLTVKNYSDVFKDFKEDYNDTDHVGEQAPSFPIGQEFVDAAKMLVERVSRNADIIDKLILGVVYANKDSCYMLKKDWDEFRIKGQGSLGRKLAGNYEKLRDKNLSPLDYLRNTSPPKDIYRLTIIINDNADFQATFWKIIEGLRLKGIILIESKNYFKAGNSYKGINAIFMFFVIGNPASGQNIEIQFQTVASMNAKKLAHAQYEEARLIIGCEPSKYCKRKSLSDKCVKIYEPIQNIDLIVPNGKGYLIENLPEGKTLESISNKAEKCNPEPTCTRSGPPVGGRRTKRKYKGRRRLRRSTKKWKL